MRACNFIGRRCRRLGSRSFTSSSILADDAQRRETMFYDAVVVGAGAIKSLELSHHYFYRIILYLTYEL